jgi:hypothetical protein
MASFKDHIEGLTGLTISTAPTTGELTQFLIDGVKEVVNRIIQLKPDELAKFCKTTDSTTTVAIVGKILSVTRQHDSTSIVRSCSKISPNLRYLATDTSSLHFRSKYNPAYYELDGLIYGVPTPNDSSNNDLVVTQVHYDVGIAQGDTYNNSDSAIDNFPIEYEYLVALYAAIKSLQNALSAVNISTFSLSASAPATVPSAPTISAGSVAPITIDALPTAPAYTAPVVTGDTQEITGTIVAGTPGTAADFINFQHWYDILADLIETEEDTELAQAQLGKIQSYIQAYSSAMQNQLNIFNKNNALYQAGVQKNLEQARINMQDAQKEADLTLQASIQDYTLELQRVSTDASKYQALVQAEVQTYTQEIQEKSTEYQWQVGRLQDLKQEYNQAFAMMAPPQPQQAGGR